MGGRSWDLRNPEIQKHVAAAAMLRGSKIFRWAEEILLYFAKIRAPEERLCTFSHVNLSGVPAYYKIYEYFLIIL